MNQSLYNMGASIQNASANIIGKKGTELAVKAIGGLAKLLTGLKVSKSVSKWKQMLNKLKDSPVGKFYNFLDKMGVVAPIVDIFHGWFEILQSGFTPLIEKLVPLFSKLTPYVSWFAEKIGTFLTLLTTKEGWKDIGQWFKDVWIGIKQWFKDKLVQPFKDAWDAIKNWFTTHIIDPIKNAWKTITTWFDANIITPIKGAWTGFVRWLVNLLADAVNWIPGVEINRIDEI